MKTIATQVKTHKSLAGGGVRHHVYFVPHRTVVCEQILLDEGVIEHVEIGEYHLGLITFDKGIEVEHHNAP
jgi:hypothetical protein